MRSKSREIFDRYTVMIQHSFRKKPVYSVYCIVVITLRSTQRRSLLFTGPTWRQRAEGRAGQPRIRRLVRSKGI